MLKRVIQIGLLYAVMLCAVEVQADSPIHPHSYAVSSANGNFVFVMIAPVSIKEDGDFESDKGKTEAQRVRNKYRTSGLYRNDGSTTPLWTVDWYSPTVYVFSDGVHIVRRGLAAEGLNDEAITFFAEGREVSSYRVGDLVDSTLLLPRTAAYFDWEKNITLDDANRTLVVTTNIYDKYTFDITTGEIISTRKLSWVVGICIAIALTLGLVKITQKLKRRTQAATPSSP